MQRLCTEKQRIGISMTASYIRSLADALLEDMKEEEKCSFVTDAESASGSLREK